MWETISLSLLVLLIWRRYIQGKPQRGDLDKIPGPPSKGIWSLLFGRDSGYNKSHVKLLAVTEMYGPIVKLSSETDESIMVSDQQLMTEVLIKSGKDFGGRPLLFRTKYLTEGTGILFSKNANSTWKELRKASQRHLRQFGDGLSRLENIITDVAEDMFVEFDNKVDIPFDPRHIVFDTALNSIAFLICGERTRSGNQLVENMREYEKLFTACVTRMAPFKLKILDIFPWVRYLGISGWKMLERHQELEYNIWQTVNEMNDANPDAHSLCRVLKASIGTGEGSMDLMDARKTSMQLLFAGVTTTSNTFYGGMNLLAHHPQVQAKLFAEIQTITGGKRDVALTDRAKMHYAKAVVHEFLRYISVVPIGVAHRTMTKTNLQGYNLPPNTAIVLNQYALHHDKKIWDEPFEFRPERFIDENGELVPADHPSRKNLLPFGAGLRVCLGESLALTRLFLWTTSLVQRFMVIPAEENTKESTDSRNYEFDGVLRPCSYQFILTRR